MTNRITILAAAALALLAGCGEKAQTIGQQASMDRPAFQGSGSAFAAPGWKPGDKGSWEQQLKTRLQNGQNDYTKVN